MTGFGHPDWARTHEAASRTAHVVSTLVQGGATCVGKAVVDELAFRCVFSIASNYIFLLNEVHALPVSFMRGFICMFRFCVFDVFLTVSYFLLFF